MNRVIAAPRGREGFLSGACGAAAVLLLALLALTVWPEAARAQNAQGVPTVDGNPRVGNVLTAVTSAITDPDGLGTFAYQWYAQEGESAAAVITGATSQSYTIEEAQLNKRLLVEVSYTDGASNEETVRSALTDVVRVANRRPVGDTCVRGPSKSSRQERPAGGRLRVRGRGVHQRSRR